ncbi:PaaI family thioesterase [Marinospirillum sp.]|uniref:PaaI family thioesterase n=1 Tax=Marinospirillum sp. TaxID=2183934 RepID=UPI00384F4ECB
MSALFEPANPCYHQEVERILQAAPFARSLGLQTVEVAPGYCETRLPVRKDHQQQDGYVHAGVQCTLTDHTGGAAGATLIPEGQLVLTADFKISLLRPVEGEELNCRARVIKLGRSLIIVESDLFADQRWDRLLARASVTLAVVAKKPVNQ